MEKIIKNIERVFNKCIILLYRGYSIQYCLSKFKKYKDLLEEYLVTIGKLKDLERIKPGNDYIKNTLDKIYSLSEEETEDNFREVYLPENNNSIKNRTKIRSLVFKPAMVFLLVFIIASFSFVGLAFGSQSSIPTETLYPVKRTVEKIELIFNPGINEGSLHFQFLESRLYEVNKLIDSNFSDNTDLINDLLLEIKDEYEQCKENNYFGDKSEEEIISLINDAINKYNNKLSIEFQKADGKSNQGKNLENKSDKNLEYNTNTTSSDDDAEVDETSSDDDAKTDDISSDDAEVDETSSDDDAEVDETSSDDDAKTDDISSDDAEVDEPSSDDDTEVDVTSYDDDSETDEASPDNES